MSFELKDGRKALLRSANEGDIEGMLNYLRISAEETPFVIRYPEECDKYTYEDEKVLFEQCNDCFDKCILEFWDWHKNV